MSDNEILVLGLPAPSQNGEIDFFAQKRTLEEVQRSYILHVLKTTGGRISGPRGAAEVLGMKRTSLNSRLKKLGLR